MDEGIAKILDYLDESGLAKNTIVIYSSDQGFYLGEHGWYDKRWMFEESLQMPFVIRWPGVIKPGSQSKALIQNIDYAPTFLELCGADIPDDIQGTSIVPILKASGENPKAGATASTIPTPASAPTAWPPTTASAPRSSPPSTSRRPTSGSSST